MGRLPEAWIAPPEVRGLREAIRHRSKLVALRSGLKAQVHAVLAKQGVRVAVSDLFGVGGQKLLDELQLEDRAETTRLLGSLRTWRDRAIAGLMLFCGLRSCEVLALNIADVDVGAGWLRVMGKGAKERPVPLDVDVAGVIQTYLLVERPETPSLRLFVVAKGYTRGQPLTLAGLRLVFGYHRVRLAVPDGHTHALRHTFGAALAEADLER
jgi:integrase